MIEIIIIAVVLYLIKLCMTHHTLGCNDYLQRTERPL